MKKTVMFRRILSVLLVVMMLFSAMAVGATSAFAAQTSAAEKSSETKTYYFSADGNWTNLFCVYAWTEGNKEAGEWKQLTKVTTADDLYSVELSTAYTHMIFASRMFPAFSWDAVDNKTAELVVPDGCNYLTLTGATSVMWGNYVDDNNADAPTQTQQIFFAPDAEWLSIQNSHYHEFAVRAWNSENTDGYWAQFELAEGNYGTESSVWTAEIPEDCTYVEFCRIEGNIESGVWNIWEKTMEQTIPASANLFTQNDDIETGTWSYYEAPETTPTEQPTEPDSSVPDDTDEPIVPVQTKTVYFTANEDWIFYTSEMASVSVYTWTTDADKGTWTWAEAVENKEGLFVAEVPEDAMYIFFGLCYGASPEVVWAQTDDLAIPDESNHFTQDEAGNSGEWSYYTGNAPAPAGKYYSVVFVNDDNTLLKVQVVAEGGAAVAPEIPEKAADAQYTYTFANWDKSFTKVTSDLVVKAVYTSTVNEYTVTFVGRNDSVIFAQSVPYGGTVEAPEAPAVDGFVFAGWDNDFDKIIEDTTVKAIYNKISTGIGALEVQVSGGSGFKISVNDGALRPQGTSYINKKMPIGTTVTLVANDAPDVEFLGWMNEAGAIVSTTDTYTFTATGKDFFKAIYKTIVEDVNVVLFKNPKAAGGNGQILDMQYYAAGDVVEFPDAPTQAGFTFTGWNMTQSDIQNKLAAGSDVVVLANWERAKIYVSVVANGGQITTAPQPNGLYLAYGAVTVKADTAEAGQKFAYWTDANGKVMSYLETYKFYPSQNTELTAVYVGENEVVNKKALVSIAGDPTTDGEKITYTVSWELDESMGTITNYGIVIVDADDYNPDTFYHGSGDSNLFDRAAKATNAVDTKSLTVSGREYDHTYYAIAFIIYQDAATGQTVTHNSDMIEITKLAP